MLNWVEYEKSFITSGPVLRAGKLRIKIRFYVYKNTLQIPE